MIEIKHRITGAVLFTHDGPTVKDALKAAIKAWANLTWANPAAKVALGWIDEWIEGRKERVSA